jgi:hypothetical protein
LSLAVVWVLTDRVALALAGTSKQLVSRLQKERTLSPSGVAVGQRAPPLKLTEATAMLSAKRPLSAVVVVARGVKSVVMGDQVAAVVVLMLVVRLRQVRVSLGKQAGQPQAVVVVV